MTLLAEDTRFELVRLRQWLTARTPSCLTTALHARFAPYFILIALAWLPWLILTWPGAMRDDTLAQYLQASGLHHYYTQHPLFDTLMFKLFWDAGRTLFGTPLAGQSMYTAAQVAALAAGSAFMLCYIRKVGAPRWLLMLSLLYLATSYVVVGSIATMGKDSLHTVFFLPFAVIFAEICRTKGAVLRRLPVAVIVTALMFASIASKRTALLIVLCAGVGMIAVCTGRKRNTQGNQGSAAWYSTHRFRALACLAAALLLAQGAWSPIAAAATHANPSPGREVWGLITQPVAQVAHDNPSAISSAQRNQLNAIMDLDKAAANINPNRTNETFQTLYTKPEPGHPAPTSSQKIAALTVWVQLGAANPGEYVTAYVGVMRGWWDPLRNFAYPTDSDYLFTPGYLQQWASYLPPDASAAQRLRAIKHDLAALMGTSHKPQWQHDALQSIRRWVRANNPLTAMALYVTWIPLALGIVLMMQAIRRKQRARGADKGDALPADVVGDSHDGGRYSSAGRLTAGFTPTQALAVYGLLAFTVLSLYASPEALFWYPIPVYFTLPLFAALPFCSIARR
ncbi:hypothetical protein JS530_01235 [Bifidobacterium sp. LC6]|uniref:Sortase B cell surface sorting signal n=1 Tax=Bifidobacterium colobi TaxID=2809026 RepID=A0ABS5UTI5_9BIFI|nr:DUF6020 family protein [Bifidobacterium colobi]MBT1174152.1 hypothetical protein [Bifidobacterium colobi]